MIIFTEEGEIDDGDVQEEDKLTYDPTKLVDFPGFNVPPSQGTKDVSFYA